MKRSLLFVLLLACGTAYADVAREPRKVPAFHAVELAGALEVDITVGKPAAVEISGEAALIPKVTTPVKNGVLVIQTDKDLGNVHHHLHATVSVPDLSNVTLSGAGKLTVSGVTGETFTIHLPGAGEITATGAAGSLHVILDGSGEVNVKQLTSKSATIELTGTGQVAAVASDAVDASLTGTGQIDVGGKPAKVKRSMTGIGNIRIR